MVAKSFGPFVRAAYNYDVKAASDEAAFTCEGESLTKQSFSEECDINTIVRRFGLTGQLPENVRAPQYGDFTGVSDYRSALHAVMQAEDAFMEMPADVRMRFHNDAAAFVDFCSNPANAEELVKLGLAVKRDPVQIDPSAGGSPQPSGGLDGAGGSQT